MLKINEGVHYSDEKISDIFNYVAFQICQLQDTNEKFDVAIRFCKKYPDFKYFFIFYYASFNTDDPVCSDKDKGFVYFGIDRSTKDIKIGFTRQSCEKRLKEISSQTGRKMTLLLKIESHYSSELIFHSIFDQYKMDGECEWFKGDELLLLAIESMRTGKIQGMTELKCFYLAKAILRGESAWSFLETWVDDINGLRIA